MKTLFRKTIEVLVDISNVEFGNNDVKEGMLDGLSCELEQSFIEEVTDLMSEEVKEKNINGFSVKIIDA